VSKKSLERRAAAAVAPTALRPVRLTGGPPGRTRGEHRWNQWAIRGVRGVLEDDDIDGESES
jgi:hypothetical protein